MNVSVQVLLKSFLWLAQHVLKWVGRSSAAIGADSCFRALGSPTLRPHLWPLGLAGLAKS